MNGAASHPSGRSEQDGLLSLALRSLGEANYGETAYRFFPVRGGKQARVWRGFRVDGRPGPSIALRLTPKPLELLRRIAAAVDVIRGVPCPRTLDLASIEVGGRSLTAHVCTWIGSQDPHPADMATIGRCLALLHLELEASPVDFSDRPLVWTRVEPPRGVNSLEEAYPAWYVASFVWRDRILTWEHIYKHSLPNQVIHGDMNLANIVRAHNGVGFIDFDKVMRAPAIFDLAKLISSGLFSAGDRARLRHQQLLRLLEGYTDVRRLSRDEMSAMEALSLLLNQETARLGSIHEWPEYQRQAVSIGGWWIARRRRGSVDPFQIDAGPGLSLRAGEQGLGVGRQLALWSDYDL